MKFLSVRKGKAGYLEAHGPQVSGLAFFHVLRQPLPVLVFSLFLIFPGAQNAEAQAPSPLPEIARLDSRDTAFKQFLSDVEDNRRLLFSSRYQTELPQAVRERLASSLTIYSYTPREGEDLLAIAARCNIPYGTLASLNRLSHKEDMVSEKPLLLPSVPGIFIAETPGTGLERLLFSARAEGAEENPGLLLSVPRGGKSERFRFVPGDDFSHTERAFFLNRGFHFPLRNFQVSSFYGPRINPVTGRSGRHEGVDLAAPEGTEVYTVRSGTVSAQGEDPVLGKYIIVSHENNWVSLYGHLSEIKTALRQELQSASLIGKVGSTGQSTGPHLHFELRQNGQTRDPARLLGLFRGSAGR